jgi:hypothetical protein
MSSLLSEPFKVLESCIDVPHRGKLPSQSSASTRISANDFIERGCENGRGHPFAHRKVDGHDSHQEGYVVLYASTSSASRQLDFHDGVTYLLPTSKNQVMGVVVAALLGLLHTFRLSHIRPLRRAWSAGAR